MKKLFVIIVFALIAISCSNNRNKLTYSDLLNQMTNFEKLAVLPADSEFTKMESSYDRKSKYDEKTGKYIDWSANGDNFNPDATEKEGDLYVLAKMKGPGCIFRFWTATADSGKIKIFIDGEEKPVVDLPCYQFFNCSQKYFNYPALCYLNEARGWNFFIPIPFQKSCKILAEKKFGNYWHFNYMKYPPATKVPSFSMDLLNSNAEAIKKVNDILQNSGEYPYAKRNDDKVLKGKETIEPGQTKVIANIEGKYAIRAIKFFASYTDTIKEAKAMRLLALQATWDDEKKPAIWSPLGDFFATSPRMAEYKTYPMGGKKGEMYSYWFMPFDKKASFEIINNDNVPQEVEYEIMYSGYEANEPLGRFHAKWHRNTFPLEGERAIDWSMLKAEGKGRFVGVMLNVWNPKAGWWGEGDEKLFVDGEKFPSTFGTGSEDYFGYAWGDPHLFQRAYHAQSTTHNNQGWQVLCRWHFSDNVPFHNGFEADIEKYQSDKRPTQYACIAYWYGEPGKEDLYSPVPAEDRYGYNTPYHFAIYKEPGVIEAEDMKVISNTGKKLNPFHGSDVELDKTSNNIFIDWYGKKGADNTLVLEFKIDKKGTYKFEPQIVKWPGLAIVQFYIDDVKIKEPINTNIDNSAKGLYKVELGEVKLDKGAHKLGIKLTGSSPENKNEDPEMAIDYVKFVKVK